MEDEFVQEGDVSQLVLPVSVRDRIQGPREATVTLLEYGDFECAHCSEAFHVVKEIRRWLRGELCYVFRYFPAIDKHPNSMLAAEAAEAAGAQGRFWEMHDLLYEHSPAIGAVDLNGHAQELDLDMKRFERELREHNYLDKVREDITSGVQSGVTRTPAFFINGARYWGAADVDGLLAAIEEAGNQAISGGNCYRQAEQEYKQL